MIYLAVKNPPAMQEMWVQSLGQEDSPGGGNGNPFQCSCLKNPHGQRSLVGYSPWGCKESDMTECLSTSTHVSRRSLSKSTQRDRVEREVEGDSGWGGSTCIRVADSC